MWHSAWADLWGPYHHPGVFWDKSIRLEQFFSNKRDGIVPKHAQEVGQDRARTGRPTGCHIGSLLGDTLLRKRQS